MNPVLKLHLASHDAGVAAIAQSPLALDWLAIAFPSPTATSTQSTPPPSTQPLSRPATDPISKKQADNALVRHYSPYNSREVLAPCFRVADRFVLGRTLGNLFVPTELGLPHLLQEPCVDARFVLDLQEFAIVEVRQYASADALLCLAYSSLSAEFLSLPPFRSSRVEISYMKEQPDAAEEAASAEEFRNSATVTWLQFCHNYSKLFPTGSVTATVRSSPGPTTHTFKKESIYTTINDPYSATFTSSALSASRTGVQARRIAPKRLLPRPST